jgi:hypothetical protein
VPQILLVHQQHLVAVVVVQLLMVELIQHQTQEQMVAQDYTLQFLAPM